MPIYAYKCSSCGHERDVLQKISDDPLTVCPSCGQAAFAKQVTAAGFQLKGSGWYVTDFRDNGSKKDKAPASAASAETKSESKSDTTGGASDASAATSTPTASPPPPSP